MKPRIVHYVGPNSRVQSGYPICGSFWYKPLPSIATTDPKATNCRRCIASLRADGLLPREGA